MLLSRLALAVLPFVGLVASQACDKLPVWTITNVCPGFLRRRVAYWQEASS